jgi:adapter protein MecA 1/2
MKIERINDNQIRCTLTSFDLSVRNINVLELAYGTEKARKLFREMIQKASNEVGFDAEDIPLMIEAIPLSNESIMLVITKIEDPEELDTRFSKFSPASEEMPDSPLAQLADGFLEGSGEGLEYIDAPASEEAQAAPGSQTPDEGSNASLAASSRIFRFQQLDGISDAAKNVNGIYNGINSLYKKPGTRQYYLVIHRAGCSDTDFSRLCNILAEYASKLPGDAASEAYFMEHYELIIQDHALQSLAKIK